MNRSLFPAVAGTLLAALPAQALPYCYMQGADGVMVNLEYMCNASPGVLATEPTVAAIESAPVEVAEPEQSRLAPATFILHRATPIPLIGETEIIGHVEFHTGVRRDDVVHPWIEFRGYRYDGGVIEKKPGLDDYYVRFSVTGRANILDVSYGLDGSTQRPVLR